MTTTEKVTNLCDEVAKISRMIELTKHTSCIKFFDNINPNSAIELSGDEILGTELMPLFRNILKEVQDRKIMEIMSVMEGGRK